MTLEQGMSDPLREALEQANDRLQTIWDHIGIDHDTPEDHERVAQECWFAMQEVDAALSAVSVPTPLDVERLMEAEHLWCVEVDGEYALKHPVEAHRRHAEHIIATLAAPQPVPEEPTDD